MCGVTRRRRVADRAEPRSTLGRPARNVRNDPRVRDRTARVRRRRRRDSPAARPPLRPALDGIAKLPLGCLARCRSEMVCGRAGQRSRCARLEHRQASESCSRIWRPWRPSSGSCAAPSARRDAGSRPDSRQTWRSRLTSGQGRSRRFRRSSTLRPTMHGLADMPRLPSCSNVHWTTASGFRTPSTDSAMQRRLRARSRRHGCCMPRRWPSLDKRTTDAGAQSRWSTLGRSSSGSGTSELRKRHAERQADCSRASVTDRVPLPRCSYSVKRHSDRGDSRTLMRQSRPLSASIARSTVRRGSRPAYRCSRVSLNGR